MISDANGAEVVRSHRSFLVGPLHGRFVSGRRALVLADHLADQMRPASRVLDVGCGDGTIDWLIKQRRPDVSIEGIDPLVRPTTRIPVRSFDGITIPYPNRSFDIVLFVDVLHHTADPRILLKEAGRVGSEVLIKDHFREGILADATLRFMDWVGNARFGVALAYNYWPKSMWLSSLDDSGLLPVEMKAKLNLYPAPFSWIFERQLHFIMRCQSRSH